MSCTVIENPVEQFLRMDRIPHIWCPGCGIGTTVNCFARALVDSKVDLKNPKRILRALEICETTGRPYSSFLKKNKRKREFSIIKIGLERERDELYARINSRVDQMIASGLEEEAREMYKFRKLNALNSVGYREFFEFFDGNISREKAIELIKRNSRRYAKRQMTWWGKDKEIKWFQADKVNEILNYISTNTSE